MPAIDLGTAPLRVPDDPFASDTGGGGSIGLSDYARLIGEGAYGVVGGVAGAADYLIGDPEGLSPVVRDWARKGAREQHEKLSPGMRRAMDASVLPGDGPDIWDPDVSTRHAIAGRVASSIPSLLASLVPGGIVARAAGVAAGTVAGGTAAGAITGGDVFNRIGEEISKAPDEELREQSDIYRGLRAMGIEEQPAKEMMLRQAAGHKPVIMAAVTALTSKYGVEGLLAGRVAGEAGRGVLRSTGRGAVGEATQEAIEGSVGAGLAQAGTAEARQRQLQLNWAEILEEAAGGALIGGILGGGVGAATARPGRSGGRRKTRDEILGREPEPEAAVPVGVTPTPVSPAQSTPQVLAEERVRIDADGQAIAAEQTNPVKAGEEMPAAIAQKPPEQLGGVDLKPAEPTPALTPAPAGVEPAHEVALTAPATVPQTIVPQTVGAPRTRGIARATVAIQQANPGMSFKDAFAAAEKQRQQLDLISQAEQELLGGAPQETPEPIPPIPAHTVVSPDIAAAITHERATSIAQGTINAKLDQARTTQNAPRPDPAAALAAAAAPAATGVAEPAATPVAPAVGLAGAAPSAPDAVAAPVVGVAETPVASIPSEVIPPTVEAPPVAPAPIKRKPGRPRKNTAAPATPGQSAPNDAETQAAKEKTVTDDAVARIAEIIRGREAALASVTDFGEGVPIATEAANRIGDIQDAAVATLGKAKAYKLADKAREFLKSEREATRPAAVAPAEPALDIEPAPAPTKGRVLKDELQARKERKGPRETAAKKAQRERGETEILGKAEDEARQRRRALDEVAASVRKAFDEVTYNRAEMSTAKAQRDYMKALVKAVALPDEPGKPGKKLSLANLPADAPGELRHLVAAKALSQGAGNEAQRFDFMANDLALREGTNLATEYASAQAGKGGASYDEDIHGARAAGETSGVNAAEEEMLDEIDRRRVEAMNARSMDERAMMLKRIASAFEGGELSPEAQKKIDLIRKLAASTTFEGERQAAAAREAAIRERAGGEGMAKYVTAGKSREGTFKAEKKARLTPAEIKARAAAARAGVQTKRENALEAGATARTEAEGAAQTEAIIRETFSGKEKLPRKEWSVDPYRPGFHHPIVEKLNELREWVNSLSDEEYDKLQEIGRYDFPRVLGAGPGEPNLLLRVWKAQLKGELTYQQWQAIVDEERGGIAKASFGEEESFKGGKGDILQEIGPVARLRERVAKTIAAQRGKAQVRFRDRVVYGEHVGSAQTVLDQIANTQIKADMRNIVEMARDNFDNTPPVFIVSAADMHFISTGEKWRGRAKDIPNEIDKGLWTRSPSGVEQILIREDIARNKDLYAHTVVHESGHSEIGLRAQFNSEIAENIHHIRREVQGAWYAAGRPPIPIKYALFGDRELTEEEFLSGQVARVDEFIIEVVSNRHLQKFLFSIPASEELRTLLALSTPDDSITPKFTMWDTIMEYFGKILGLAKPDVSLLDVALRQWEVLNEYMPTQASLAASEAQMSAYRGEEIVESAKDLPKSLPAYLQRWGLAGATVDQIVRWTHTLFESNAMRRFEKALQQMHATSNDEDKRGQKLAGLWEQLSRDDPLQVQQAAEVFNTANIYDLDPSKPADQDSRLSGNKMRHVQRKAMFPQLRENFLALKPSTQELMVQTSGHFKSLQVKQITQATHNLLYGAKKFTPAQIKDITDATLNGKLTAADPDNLTGQSHQEIIDDDGTWRLLKNYFSVLKARGMYFPLMRHGNWVVTTDPKMPEDLKGAKILTDKTTRATKTLEWRGSESDEKALRAKHDAFFEENTDPTQVSTRIVRYKPGTDEEISEADSRGHAHDIAFRSVVQTQGVYFFESNAQARRFIRQSQDLNPDAKPLEKKNWDRDGGIAAAELSGLMSTIDRRADLSTQQKEMTKSIVKQAAVQLMPGNRMQHRALKRKGVKGADTDIARNTSEYSTAASSVLGKMTHMPAAREALEDMSAQHKANLDNKQDPNNQLRGQIINELVRRIDTHVLDPKSNSRVVQNIMTLTFSAKLLSPAYWIMNGTQPWTVLLPSLGAKYGNMKSSGAVWNAYRAIGLNGALIDSAMNMGRSMSPSALKKVVMDLDDPWKDIRRNVAKQEDGELLTRMFKEVIDVRGLVDDASAFELGHGISRGAFTSALGKLDRIARQVPFGVEAINRSVTLVSAFRLQYAIDQNYDAAVQAAIDELQSTQFNYASYNQPAFFNKPILRPGVQFKKFAQNIFALLAGAIHQSFQGATKKERKQAQKLLMNFFGVTMVTAGMMGLPGLELLRVAFTLSALLGFTDGWEDQERKLRRLLRESIGKTPEELISKGILSRAAGIDLSTRLGYADMFTFSEPKTMDAEGMYAYLARLFAGAPGSVISDFGSGIAAAGNGDWTQAIIKMVPAKVVADIAKAARGRFDATTKEPINNAEAVMQAIGFRSARMAERGEEVGAKVSQNKKFQARAKELNAAYLAASTKGELLKIRAQIIAHNKAVEAAKAGIRQKAYAPKTLDRIRDEKRTRREALVGAD